MRWGSVIYIIFQICFLVGMAISLVTHGIYEKDVSEEGTRRRKMAVTCFMNYAFWMMLTMAIRVIFN